MNGTYTQVKTFASKSSNAGTQTLRRTYHLANAATPARDQDDLALDVEEVVHLEGRHSSVGVGEASRYEGGRRGWWYRRRSVDGEGIVGAV